eukprot:1252478-Rhodomonas_salina.1
MAGSGVSGPAAYGGTSGALRQVVSYAMVLRRSYALSGTGVECAATALGCGIFWSESREECEMNLKYIKKSIENHVSPLRAYA